MVDARLDEMDLMIEILHQPVLRQVDARVWEHTEYSCVPEHRSRVVTRDLSRLYALYQTALENINITVNEAWLLARATSLVSANLPARIKSLSPLELMALTDAAERVWMSDNPCDDTIRQCFHIKRKFHIKKGCVK